MPLSEAQVVRYSRQILLRGVGGKGQEKLLAAGAKLGGQGAAIATAGAYLAAGGTPVSCGPRNIASSEVGFLFERTDVGRPASPALQAALSDLNPDARPSLAPVGAVGEAPPGFGGPGPWVALGYSGPDGVVVFRSAKACEACFELDAGELSNGPDGPLGVLLGSLGALVYQRLVLDLPRDTLGALHVSTAGDVSAGPVRRCSICAGAGPASR